MGGVRVRIMFILKSNHNNKCNVRLKSIICKCRLMMGIVLDTVCRSSGYPGCA